MDLIGGYNSDSDTDSDENNAAEFRLAVTTATTTTSATTERSARTIRGSQVTRSPLPASTTTKTKSKADRKKRIIGKKLLKLSAVLPEHILRQLQLGGGGDTKDKSNDSSDDDEDDEKPSSRRKTITSIAASSRDYSRDEGIMGLLSELSKSNSSSSKKKLSTKILGCDELFSSSTEMHDDSPVIQSSMPPTENPKLSSVTTTSEPLGAAFLTSTIETTKRKRQGPTAIRSIHENVSDRQIGDRKEGTSFSETSGYTTHVPSATSAPTSNQASTVPRSSTSTIAPPLRIKPISSLRLAAPPVGISSTTYSSHKNSIYAPVVSQHSTGHKQGGGNSSYEQMHHYKEQEAKNRNSTGGRTQPKKKKQLSRKRQMEQMLRAGKLDEVQGDHELEGVSHVYNQEGDSVVSMMSSSSSNGVGVRVVPTGSYDASAGATAMSTDVTCRQKNSNQLNSLLANAASLESHRAQNPQFHTLSGKGKSGSQRATAKRKYGW